jgi:universal stress protein A
MDALIKKIVVPVDFSAPSEAAAHYAAALADRLGASLHLIHALEPSALARSPLESYETLSAESLDDVYWAARTRLSALSVRLALAGQISKEVRPGFPSEVITAAATDLGADLVVMSTHGRTGLSYLLMGSVAERVIRSTACPVLVVRDRGEVAARRQPSVELVAAVQMARAS